MPICECDNCGGDYRWSWTEAFDEFGFRAGDGQIETWRVAAVLKAAGYAVTVEEWGRHNAMIVSILRDGVEHIPYGAPGFIAGHSDPRRYFPQELVRLLDNKLPDS